MIDAGSDEEVTRGELTEAGWKQGTLFSWPTAYLSWNTLGDDSEPVIDWATLGDGDLLVVATQDCDLHAHGKTEPFIEALVCRATSDKNILRAGRRNSSRYFTIETAEQLLVVYALDRLQIDKRALRSLIPQPWPGSEERLNRFRKWLARRYDRPAIPDEIVESFQQPMNKCIGKLEKKRASLIAMFNQIISEIRINIPPAVTPPFAIEVLLVTDCSSISESQAQCVEDVMEEISESMDPDKVMFEGWRILNPEEISVAEYLATRPLLYDYLTYSGDEVTGSEPLQDP